MIKYWTTEREWDITPKFGTGGIEKVMLGEAQVWPENVTNISVVWDGGDWYYQQPVMGHRIPYTGGTYRFNVTCDGNWSFYTQSPDLITVTIVSGGYDGDAVVDVTVPGHYGGNLIGSAYIVFMSESAINWADPRFAIDFAIVQGALMSLHVNPNYIYAAVNEPFSFTIGSEYHDYSWTLSGYPTNYLSLTPNNGMDGLSNGITINGVITDELYTTQNVTFTTNNGYDEYALVNIMIDKRIITSEFSLSNNNVYLSYTGSDWVPVTITSIYDSASIDASLASDGTFAHMYRSDKATPIGVGDVVGNQETVYIYAPENTEGTRSTSLTLTQNTTGDIETINVTQEAYGASFFSVNPTSITLNGWSTDSLPFTLTSVYNGAATTSKITAAGPTLTLRRSDGSVININDNIYNGETVYVSCVNNTTGATVYEAITVTLDGSGLTLDMQVTEYALSFTVDPTSIDAPYSGGTYTITASTNIDSISWAGNLRADRSEITGNQFTFRLPDNSGSDARTGVLTLNSGSLSASVNLTQASGIMVLTPNPVVAPPEGGTIVVTSNMPFKIWDLRSYPRYYPEWIYDVYRVSENSFKFTVEEGVEYAREYNIIVDYDTEVSMPSVMLKVQQAEYPLGSFTLTGAAMTAGPDNIYPGTEVPWPVVLYIQDLSGYIPMQYRSGDSWVDSMSATVTSSTALIRAPRQGNSITVSLNALPGTRSSEIYKVRAIFIKNTLKTNSYGQNYIVNVFYDARYRGGAYLYGGSRHRSSTVNPDSLGWSIFNRERIYPDQYGIVDGDSLFLTAGNTDSWGEGNIVSNGKIIAELGFTNANTLIQLNGSNMYDLGNVVATLNGKPSKIMSSTLGENWSWYRYHDSDGTWELVFTNLIIANDGDRIGIQYKNTYSMSALISFNLNIGTDIFPKADDGRVITYTVNRS